MAVLDNLITISGEVYRVNNRFVTIKSKLANGKISFVNAWNLPESIKEKQFITVLGRLDFITLVNFTTKQILGVNADKFWNKDEHVNVLTICGEISSRKNLVRLPSGQDSLNFSLKLSDGNTISVVAFDELARSIAYDYSLNEIVKIGGVLVSRAYDKIIDGKCVKKMSMEVVASSIRKEIVTETN